MNEQSKAAKRRFNDGNFHFKYFNGIGIDIGAGQDSLDINKVFFPAIRRVRGWDMPDGDAQYMESVSDNTYDFVHSSHCLEHMVDYNIALKNWIRIVKPGGYVIVTIPEETMYEHNKWPSNFNSDHKWSFTLNPVSDMPKSVNVLHMLLSLNYMAVPEKIELINQFYHVNAQEDFDQTLLPNTECCIEFILRKI